MFEYPKDGFTKGGVLMMTKTLAAFLVAGGIASAASAGSISIAQIGGGLVLNAGPLSPAVFGNDQTTWSHTSLIAAHAALNGSGVNTEGKVTILAADTTHGLSLMVLFDRDVAGQIPISMGNVGMTSVAHGSSLAYLNAGAGNITISPNGPGSRTATGVVQWNSNGGGNGFAWAGLNNGNTMTFRFNRMAGASLGLMDPETFQFVNWNGSGWSLINIPSVDRSFTVTDDFGFSANALITTSIPLPAGGVMGGASLLGLAMFRRRAR